jgi:predicted transcriptional regulator
MNDISAYLNNDTKPLQILEKIADVQDFFADTSFSHFPVLDKNIYLGCIACDDADGFDSDKKIDNYRYTLEGFFARENMIWIDVIQIFAKNHTNLLPVLDDQNDYLGYYELENIVKFFNETPFLSEPGNIIIVQKPIADYAMGQIVQIVESNNGKVLGSFVSESSLSDVQVTIKIALGSMNEILQSFRRYEYEIISTHEEDVFLNNLKERSEYLDKYLSI